MNNRRPETMERITTPELAKAFIAEGRIHIGLTRDSDEMLYIDVRCSAGELRSQAVIAREHTGLVYQEGPAVPTVDRRSVLSVPEAEEEGEDGLTLRRVFEFATTAPLEDLEKL